MAATALLLVHAAAAAAGASAIDDYVRAEMERNGVPGAAIAVWRNGAVIYAKGFGIRSASTREPMTADTPVDLASVSKSLTAAAVDRLRREGKIDPDARAVQYLPELGPAFQRVRVRHLLRHTSGLARRHDALIRCCEYGSEYGLNAAARRLADHRLVAAPGVEFRYANSNYILLAAIVERVSERSFPSYMRECVFRRFGMLRTTLDPDEARLWGPADPHAPHWRESGAIGEMSLGWYGSSLVKSTARDMAAYLGSVLGSRRRGWAEPYDDGWFVRRRSEWPGSPLVLEHGGNTWGGNTAAIVVPAWRMGAVVLLNVAGDRAVAMARNVVAGLAGVRVPRAR